MNSETTKYIKSPLNYVGGKYKLLDQIIPTFPDKIHTFVDLFGGGFNVGINVNAEHIIYNDSCKPVVELLKYLKEHGTQQSLHEIDNLINFYKLSKTNKDGYLELREEYNRNLPQSNPIMLYVLLCHAFNYQIRFNKSGEFNMPFGLNRSSFNSTLRQKFITFVDRLESIDVIFTSKSFEDFDYDILSSEDFVYADPPYLNSVATYNESWTENEEQKLLHILTDFDSKGIHYALSNNLKYENPLLNNWIDGHNISYLNMRYNNCNYHKIDKSSIDEEVLISNLIHTR